MALNEAISGRRSIREYTEEAVDGRTIHRLIDAAVRAPNTVNQQPWTFTAVVRGQTALDRISRDAKSHMLATMPASPQRCALRCRHGDEVAARLPTCGGCGRRVERQPLKEAGRT
jgi:nitroreductase